MTYAWATDVRRILALEDWFASLACQVRRELECTVVTSSTCPGRFDANHVRCIDAAGDPRGFVQRFERFFLETGRRHCSFATDVRTVPAGFTLALREADYAPEPGVVQVLERDAGRHFRRRAGVRVVKAAPGAEAGSLDFTGDWSALAKDRYAGWGGGDDMAQRAAELDRLRLQQARDSGGDAWAYVAYALLRDGSAAAAGCIEVFLRHGVAKLDRLFVPRRFRGRGIGGTLMAAAVADASQAADCVYLVAASYDWPRYYYLRNGFVDLTETVLWTKRLAGQEG